MAARAGASQLARRVGETSRLAPPRTPAQTPFSLPCLPFSCSRNADPAQVSVTLAPLEKQFNRDDHALTTAITLTLLFRSLGAILFGLLADRFGRKWTLVVNLLLIAVFELASGFVNTFQEFLGVRAIFGIVMGGIWGQAAAT